MRFGSIIGSLCIAVALLGCGEDTVEVEPPPPNTAAKTQLEHMAETGEPMGSGGMEIQMAIEKIKETDPAKADKLQGQFDSLVSERNPGKIKATAKEMAAEL